MPQEGPSNHLASSTTCCVDHSAKPREEHGSLQTEADQPSQGHHDAEKQGGNWLLQPFHVPIFPEHAVSMQIVNLCCAEKSFTFPVVCSTPAEMLRCLYV